MIAVQPTDGEPSLRPAITAAIRDRFSCLRHNLLRLLGRLIYAKLAGLEYEPSDLTRRSRDDEDKRNLLITHEEKHLSPQYAAGKRFASQR